MVAADSVAAMAAEALKTLHTPTAVVSSSAGSPPLPLQSGWVLKESRSQPGYYFYFHQETGVSSWQPPRNNGSSSEPAVEEKSTLPEGQDTTSPQRQAAAATTAAATSSVRTGRPKEGEHSSLNRAKQQHHKRPFESADTATNAKRARRETTASDDGQQQQQQKKSSTPTQVRVLHILRKHKDARRPSSWRNPKITITKEEATAELQEFVSLLHEVQSDPAELRATLEELARTESDCSSAKRGGDLGWFGRGKMQPAFEAASFGLKVGELSGIVETSSGVHVLLRVG